MGVHVLPIWTSLPSHSPYHPSGSSQCTSPKHPVSFIEPGLAISFIFDIIHVSMWFSQIIPPLPSPTKSKRLFYTSVSFFCLAYSVIITIFLNSIRNKSPVQVRWRIQDAWGWCTGMTQRDGMGREVGGGFRMGNTCTPWQIHVDVWQNQYNTVK